MVVNTSARPNTPEAYYDLFRSLFKETKVVIELIDFCVLSISKNDPAHNLGHVYQVCELTARICDLEKVPFRAKTLAMIAALFHDLGCRYERSKHHLISYGLVYEYLNHFCPNVFSDEELMVIATAVLEHRSSNKTKPSNIISEIVSVADTGDICTRLSIKRCLQFRKSSGIHAAMTVEQICQDVADHLIEKFGDNGYHWVSYPDLGLRYFKDGWDELKSYLTPTGNEKLMAMITEVYNEVNSSK